MKQKQRKLGLLTLFVAVIVVAVILTTLRPGASVTPQKNKRFTLILVHRRHSAACCTSSIHRLTRETDYASYQRYELLSTALSNNITRNELSQS